jgi:hypothetical protein
MAYEQKPGEFALFKNDKGDNPKRPDYTGNGLSLTGSRIKVSAWLKKGAKGTFMSCRFQEMTPGEPARGNPEEKKPAGRFDDMADDIPF